MIDRGNIERGSQEFAAAMVDGMGHVDNMTVYMKRGQFLRASRSAASGSAAVVPGRPRDARIDAAALDAVLRLLSKDGYAAVSIDAVARSVGASRATIYRRWPSKPYLIAAAILRTMGDQPAANTGHVRKDLRAAVGTLIRAFAGPIGRTLPGLISDMAQHAELASEFRRHVLAVRRASIKTAIDRGVQRGELRADVDPELLIDMLTAPFYFRLLFEQAPVERESAHAIVDFVLRASAVQKREP